MSLQTAAAYLEAAGFCLSRRTAHFRPGFWPSAWQKKADGKPHVEPPVEPHVEPVFAATADGCQRGFLGQLPCVCPDDVDFWVLIGCFRGRPGFIFARGQDKKPFLNAELEALQAQSHFYFPARKARFLRKEHTPVHGLDKNRPDAAREKKDSPEAAPEAHCVAAAWAALAFEKLALGLLPEAGGGSITPWGEAELWEAP